MTTPGACAELRIFGVTDHIYVDGTVRQTVKLNTNGFFGALLLLPTARCIDLLRLAAGAYTVDRIFKRKTSELNDGTRRFHLTFEVKDLPFWRQKRIVDLLEEILSFLTADDWRVEFSESTRDIGHQDFLELPRPFEPQSAILYSGGLDSAAGLATKLLAGANDVLLITVGHQAGMHARTARQLSSLRRVLKGRTEKPLRYLHSTLTTSLEGGKSKRTRLQEQTQRSRSFLFCAAAAVAARAYRLEAVNMLENGIGAINLPPMTGMLGNGLASRGAHPTFLRLMSDLAGEVTDGAMRFELPFSTVTKAEVLNSLEGVDGLPTWLQESRSCVHTSLRQAGKTHCGCCPACLERRQAFACAGIAERVDIYQVDVLADQVEDEVKSDYFHLYRMEAQKWADGNHAVRERMHSHLRLTDVSKEKDDEIYALQLRHAHEVMRVFGSSP